MDELTNQVIQAIIVGVPFLILGWVLGWIKPRRIRAHEAAEQAETVRKAVEEALGSRLSSTAPPSAPPIRIFAPTALIDHVNHVFERYTEFAQRKTWLGIAYGFAFGGILILSLLNIGYFITHEANGYASIPVWMLSPYPGLLLMGFTAWIGVSRLHHDYPEFAPSPR